MAEPRFTIVIPCYNYGRTLERAVASVHKQLITGDEILVINDGSTDNTALVCEQLSKNYQQVRCIHQSNSGAAKTRNIGIAEAKNLYLVFLDADDEMLPNGLACLREGATSGAELVVADYVTQQEDGKENYRSVGRLRRTGEQRFLDYLDKKIILANGACAMHKQIFAIMRYPESFRNTEDVPVFAYALATAQCTYVPKPVLRVYRHAGSLRTNLQYALQAGEGLVDAVFRPDLLPPSIMRHRSRFLSQRLLSQFRTAYLNEAWTDADNCYRRAVAAYPLNLFKLSYLRKYLRMRLTGKR